MEPLKILEKHEGNMDTKPHKIKLHKAVQIRSDTNLQTVVLKQARLVRPEQQIIYHHI